MKRWYGVVQDQTGRPIQGASVSVYASGTITPLVTIYAASGSRTAPVTQTNPMTTDANGEYSFAAADGNYDIVITGGSIASKTLSNVIFVDELTTFPSPQLGTVTSVSLSLPAMFTVTGSPLTGAGTLSATLASQTANYVFAAPAGSAGAPVFRALVTGDLPAIGTAGTYGSATQTPQFTTDAKGRVTGVTPVTIAPTFANVASKPTTLSGYGITDGASLTTAQQYTAQQNVTMATLTYAATVNTNCNLGNVFYLAATGNFTLADPTNPGSGGCYVWFIKQDAAGSRLITFGSKFKFAGGVAPTLSTASNAMDRLVATYDATNALYYCSLDKGFA
jgi:hypothetical protein